MANPTILKLLTHTGDLIYPVSHTNAIKVNGLLANLTDILNPGGVGYCVCESISNSSTKEASIQNFQLKLGGSFHIKMLHSNSANNVQLNISQTGAKPLIYNSVLASSSNTWEDGEILSIYYDGNNYLATKFVNDGGRNSDISITFLGDITNENDPDNNIFGTSNDTTVKTYLTALNSYLHGVEDSLSNTVPTGGSVNQVLTKTSNNGFSWANLPASTNVTYLQTHQSTIDIPGDTLTIDSNRLVVRQLPDSGTSNGTIIGLNKIWGVTGGSSGSFTLGWVNWHATISQSEFNALSDPVALT